MASVNATFSPSADRTSQHAMMSPSTSPFASPADNAPPSLLPSPAQRETTASQSLTQNWNDSFPFDVVPNAPIFSPSGGGDNYFNESSVSLLPSSAVFDTTLNPVSSSLEGNGASGVLTEDWSGVFSGKDVITTFADTGSDSVQQTTLLPTPSSELPPVSSAIPPFGNGDQGDSLRDILIITVPVGATILIVIVILIVLCVVCCRRKKPEEGKVVEGQLWKEGGPLQVSVVPMIGITSATDSDTAAAVDHSSEVNTTTVMTGPVGPTDDGQLLYKAVHEFPGQLDSQLTLTPGDVIRVEAMADHGWLRGVIRGENRSGWFPSSFVVPLNEGEGKPAAPEREEAGHGGRPRISSFLLRKKPSKRPPQLDTGPSLTQLHSQASLTKKGRTVGAVTDSSPLNAEDFAASVRDKHFKALFPYKAAYRGELSLREGEVVVGRERDRNGWMLGRSVHTGREGWFPSVYVDQVTEDVASASQSGPRDDKGIMTSSTASDDVYTLLDVNRNKSPDQAWIAIKHRAVQHYTPQTDSHMWLEKGEEVAVVAVTQSGWCLGCRGDRLGWFPLDRVELVEERSEGKLDSFSLLPLCKDPQHPASPLDMSQDWLLSEGERPRPARVAPRPPLTTGHPLQGSEGNLSTASLSNNPRPARPAPAPPSAKARCDSADSLDGGRGKGVSAPGWGRKPRVLRLAKERVGIDKLSSFPGPLPPSPSPSPTPTPSSCGSPPVMPPSGSLNLFFLKAADNPAPRPAAPDDVGSDVTETRVVTVQSQPVPADSGEQEGRPPGGEQSEGGGGGARDTQTREEPSDSQDSRDPPVSPAAASIAVQTDLSDLNHCHNGHNHHPRHPRSEGELTSTPVTTTSASLPTENAGPSDDTGCGQEVCEERAVRQESSAIPQHETTDPGPCSPAEHGQSHSDADQGTAQTCRQTPTETETPSSPSSSDTDESATSTDRAPSSGDTDQPPPAASDIRPSAETHPAQFTASQDLGPGAKIPSQPLTPKPASQDLGPGAKIPPQPLTPKPASQDLGPGSKIPPQPLTPKPTSQDLGPGAKIPPQPLTPKPASQDLGPGAKNPPQPLTPKSASQDLGPGAKIPPQPLTPKPASPVLADRQARPAHPASDQGDSGPGSFQLTPVVRPLSQKEGEGEEGVVIPPEGVCGRVSLIVHHINRMSSREEPHPHSPAPTKTSISSLPPLLSPVPDSDDPNPDCVKADHPPSLDNATCAGDASSASPEQMTGGWREQEREDGGRGGAEGRTRDTRHPRNRAEKDRPSSVPAGHEPCAGTAQHGGLPETQVTSRAEQPSEQQRGEGQPRRPSSKGGRVAPPPPPTSPPPPHTRKSQRLKAGREKS